MNRQELLASVPDVLPSYIFVVDPDGRIVAFNDAARALFGGPDSTVFLKRAGDAVCCIHAGELDGGCGTTAACGKCSLRSSVNEVMRGKPTARRRVRLELRRPEGNIEVVGVVTAARIERGPERFAVVKIENLEELLDLQKTLPLCMTCGKVQLEDCSWVRVESMFHRKFAVDVSHGYCPACAAEAMRQMEQQLSSRLDGE